MGQTWAAFCKGHWEDELWSSLAPSLSIRHGLNPAPQPCGLTAPALPQWCRQAEHLHNMKHFMFPAETSACHSTNTAHHVLLNCQDSLWFKSKTYTESRGRVYVKNFYLQHSVTRSIFIIALNCLQGKVTTDAAVSSSHQSNCFLSFLLFQHFGYFDEIHFYYIALLSPLFCLKI